MWLPVVDYEGFYEVSNIGNVRGVKNPTRFRPNQKPVTLKAYITKFGYRQFGLIINGKVKCKRGCRLVAMAFIPNPSNKPCVNHKNGIKTDDSVTNLEWVTYSENEQHSYNVLGKNTRGRKKKTNNGISYHAKKVICTQNGIVYTSITAAANSLNLFRGNITKQIKGQLKQTGGYTFNFL